MAKLCNTLTVIAEEKKSLVDTLVTMGIAYSKANARQLIITGMVSINGVQVREVDRCIEHGDQYVTCMGRMMLFNFVQHEHYIT